MSGDEGKPVQNTSGFSVDEIIKREKAKEYLVRLEEIRRWLHKVIGSPRISLDQSIIEFESLLRTSVNFAWMANKINPQRFPESMIFDPDFEIYQSKGQVFKHIENIFTMLKCMEFYELPKVFYPISTDIYDKKNMPKAIYSVYAFAILLRKKGILAFGIESLDNKVDFKDEDIKTISNEFDKLGIVLPHFGKIDGMIANEISFDKAQVLAALIKINEAIDEQSLENLRNSLGLPAAEITNIDEDLIDAYMLFLSKIKKQKEEAAILIHGKDDLDEMDYFEKNLTQKEIQNEVITSFVLTEIDKSIKNGNEDDLYKYLQDKKIHLKVTLNEDHKTYYLNEMTSKRKNAAKHYEKTKTYYLDISDIESGIETATINAHRDLEIKNCLDMLKIAVIENNLDKFALAIQTKALEIDNIDTNNLHNYLDYLRKLYKEDNNIVFDKNTIQSCINAVNGDVVNKKKIENILLDIKSAVKSWDLDKLEELLKSSLLGLEVDDDNIFLYGKLIAEDLSSVDNLTNLKDLIAKAAEIKEKCKHLSLLTINVTKNTNENSMKAYLNDNVTGIEDFDENSIELYTQRVKECLDKIYWKENKESVINKAILTNYFRGEMKNGLEFFYDESSDKLSWTQDKNKIIDRSRLNRNQIQKIIAHANCFTSISLKKDDIDNLVDLFRSLLEKKLISDRYNNIIDNIDNIEKIQFFLVNLVGMNEFKRLMSGEKIPFSVLSKFIGILFPTKSDYEQSLEHFRLKSEVKEEIIKLQNKESQIKELEIQTGLLIRSAYSHREKQNESHATDSFLDLRKERVETFRKYGQLFYCLQSKQKYFAMLIDSMRNKTDASLPSIILATFNYLSTSEDEARALQVLTLALKLQMNSEEMIENLIAGNPLLFEYSTHFFKCMRNDESKKFLDSIVPIIDEIISLKKGCYYLNPLKIYVTLTDNRPDTLDTETALENPDITKKLDENIDLIISYAKNILSKFKDDPNSIPYPVRYCFKVILENEELTTKQKRKIIANLFFSKYLSYMIAIPEDNKLTTKKFEEIGDDARYILSEVRNILKNIAFGKLYGESYLNRLNTFIEESHEELCSAYEKIIDIRVLSEEYQILNNSDYVETLETVTEHVDKILHLHKLLNTYAPQFRLKGDDILMQCLKSLGEPNIDNFLRDTSVDNIKKMEMARKFVGIDLVRKIKQVDPNKPLSSKKKLLNAKLMVIQMLFAVDMNNFNPNTINELLDHHWTDVEHQKHKDNIELSEQFQLTHAQEDEKKTVNRSSSKLSADSSLAGYSHRSNAVLVEELRKTLPEIQVLTKQLINELAESKILSKDDNYQKLIDLISEDVKNAHKRNVSMRREQAILKKSKDDLKKRSKESDSMKDYFRKYIDSLEKNYNRDSTNKRKSIFSIIKPKTVKEKTYSAEKFKKNGIVKEIKLNVANSPKHYSFRITPLDKGKFDISFIVLGNEQETKTFDMTSLLLQSYNKETQFEGLKGIIFDVKKLYNFLEAFRAG